MSRGRGSTGSGAGAAVDAGAIRVRFVVRGRVQGVWYRGSARERALALGIRGWARNRADGSVEIVAEGTSHALEVFEAWCQRGPSGARVTSVVREGEPTGEPLATFHMRT